ncbi:hypothetical protein ACS0PU_011980 [Formica fusca]
MFIFWKTDSETCRGKASDAVCPAVTTATEWPEKTRQLCKILTERQEGWMQIVHPLGDRTAMVKLMIYNEYTEGAHNLRDSLIQLGNARLTENITTDVYPTV